MFREPSELSLTRRPAGCLPSWVNVVIALACAVSFATVSIGSAVLWDQLPTWIDLGYFRHGLTFFISFWILISLLPPWSVSRAIRVAVLLPIAHAVMIACAWPVWSSVSAFVGDATAVTTFAARFPLGSVIAATTVTLAGVAGVVARRRSGEWIHGFAIMTLALLLVLGLWLPIACARWPGDPELWWPDYEPLLANAPASIALVVVPPALVAIGFTSLALRRPAALLPARRMFGALLGVLLGVGLVARTSAGGRALLMYANFVPLLLAAAIVAIIALAVLGGVTWWRAWSVQRRFGARERRGGAVQGDGDEPVFGVEITSWLRGPRVVQRPFAIVTTAGTVPVSGAHLVAAVLPATTQLRIGERLGVLRPGDEVVLAGADDATTGSPFRLSAAPLTDELFVAPVTGDPTSFASIALVMWRPCVAYLLIISAIALPALAALLSG